MALVQLKITSFAALPPREEVKPMPIVTGVSQRWRIIAAHAGLWVLIGHAVPAAGGGVASRCAPATSPPAR
jgi:hypothetical protein